MLLMHPGGGEWDTKERGEEGKGGQCDYVFVNICIFLICEPESNSHSRVPQIPSLTPTTTTITTKQVVATVESILNTSRRPLTP